MDIFNSAKRKVRCVRNYDGGWWSCRANAPLLTVDKVYNMTYIDVHSWYTEVYLSEFPGKTFNSVLFEEVEEVTNNENDHR